MDQAPSKRARGRKRQTRAKLPLIFNWRHRSLRGSLDSRLAHELRPLDKRLGYSQENWDTNIHWLSSQQAR